MADPLQNDDPFDALVADFVGPRWESHYRAAWTRIGSRDGLRYGLTWNWAAAFFTIAWIAYRRRFILAAVIMVLLTASLVVIDGSRGVPIYCAALFLAFGLVGDRLVLGPAIRAANAAIRVDTKSRTAGRGGVSRTGAAIFLLPTAWLYLSLAYSRVAPRDYKWKSYRASMLSELRVIEQAQETYFAKHGLYATVVDSLYDATPGMSAPTIVVTARGWSATVTRSQVPEMICGIAVGIRNPVSGRDSTDGGVCTWK